MGQAQQSYSAQRRDDGGMEDDVEQRQDAEDDEHRQPALPEITAQTSLEPGVKEFMRHLVLTASDRMDR